jgi:hypothetical protein
MPLKLTKGDTGSTLSWAAAGFFTGAAYRLLDIWLSRKTGANVLYKKTRFLWEHHELCCLLGKLQYFRHFQPDYFHQIIKSTDRFLGVLKGLRSKTPTLQDRGYGMNHYSMILDNLEGFIQTVKKNGTSNDIETTHFYYVQLHNMFTGNYIQQLIHLTEHVS